MITISACLIMKNESKSNEFFPDKTNIDVCLGSLKKFCDEIIVIDTGSTDNSINNAKQYTDKVYEYIQEGSFDFSKARNKSFSMANCDYILWTDMDDYYSEENINKILKLKQESSGEFDYYSWYYDYRHNGNVCTYSFIRDRLVRNNNTFFWRYSIHEELVCNGRGKTFDNITTIHTSNHDNGKKYVDMFKKLEKERELYPREMYYYGGELFVLGEIDECIRVLEQFETKNYSGSYENKRTQDYLGRCYQYKKDFVKAKEHFLRYGAYENFNRAAVYNIADCCFDAGEYKQAIFYYSIVVNAEFTNDNLTKINDNKLIIDSCIQLCVCYYKIKDLQKSIYYNNLALKLDPKNTSANSNAEFFKKFKK